MQCSLGHAKKSTKHKVNSVSLEIKYYEIRDDDFVFFMLSPKEDVNLTCHVISCSST